MRIKEILRTSNLTWSPESVHPMYIAAGTSAKQLDASFSTSSSLELFEVDTSAKGWDMPVKGSLNIASRFNVLNWGNADKEMGVIAGGGDNGVVSLWDPAKILSGDGSPLICELPKHCGPVRSIDFNPSKKCLLASGASASEIHIIDINNPEVLMTPGPKAQPEDDVVALAWNKQVEHILGSAHPNSARTIVWDLRKNEPIIQVTDASNRLRCSCIAWHPDIATQLLTCSDEDRYPVIQVWDLRFATAPTMVLEGHQRGIQTVAWCAKDSGLFLTCSRDDHMICWNPNNTHVPGGEKVVEFTSPSQWTFDMEWCPRNPYLVGSSSFSGKLSVFSLFGGQEEPQEDTSQRVRYSSDPFAPPPPAPSQPMNIPPMTRAPHWLMKPCGVSFGFGGKLISFDSSSATLTIEQVITESEVLERSGKLEVALQDNTLLDFCEEKVQSADNGDDKQIWNFLKSTFDGKPRQKYLELLGYKVDDLKDMVSNMTDSVSELTLDNDTAIINKSDADSSSSEKKEEVKKEALVITTDDSVDGVISRAMLLGQFEVVVDLCLKAGRMADALAVAMAGGRELFQKTQQEYFRQANSPSASLLSYIISQNWANLVETVQLENWKEALAILLSYAKPTEFNALCDTLAGRLSDSHQLEATLCYVCSGNVTQLLACWQAANNGDNTTPLQLQELIEKVMCLQSTNNNNRPLEGEQVVNSLLKYSKILAEQGKLSNALTYINTTPTDTAAQFKYQLHMAINDPSLPRPPVPYRRTRLTSSASSHANSSVGAPSTYSTYTGYTNPASSYNPTPNMPTPSPSIISSYTAPSTKVSYQAPSYKAPEPQKPPTPTYSQPPTSAYNQPPTSNFNQPPTSSYNQPPPATNPYTPQPTTYTPPTSYGGSDVGSYSGVSQYNPYTPSTVNEPTPPQPKPITRTKEAWNDPPMLKKKAAPSQPVTQQKITTPVVGPIKHVDLNPGSAVQYGQQGPMSGQYGQQGPAPGQYGQQGPAPGQYGQQGPDPGQYGQQGPASGQYGQQGPGQYGQQGPTSGQYEQQGPASGQYEQQVPASGQYGQQDPTYGQHGQQGVYNPTQFNAQPAAPEPTPPPAPVEKPPVPEHCTAMIQVLESSITDCKNVTQNPTHKRKLDEVTVKIEALKDKLRYDAVSGTVVEKLNVIAGSLNVKDYNSALHVSTTLAQTANFSEVGAFLPGIKTLLQIGAQLHAVHHY